MLNICHCLKCGHEWASRLYRVPRMCPSCKAPKWMYPKVYRPRLPDGRTRAQADADRRKYTFHDLRVGESEKWTFSADAKENARRWYAKSAHERRTGKKFAWNYNTWTLTRIK